MKMSANELLRLSHSEDVTASELLRLSYSEDVTASELLRLSYSEDVMLISTAYQVNYSMVVAQYCQSMTTTIDNHTMSRLYHIKLNLQRQALHFYKGLPGQQIP